MRKRKCIGLWITVFVAIVALFASTEVRADSTGPSLSTSKAPLRLSESFKLGDTGCRMDIDLEDGTKIEKAVTRSIDEPNNKLHKCYKELDKIPIRKRFICEGSVTAPINCLPKTFVERAIMEKSGNNSKYCYSSGGYTVCYPP